MGGLPKAVALGVIGLAVLYALFYPAVGVCCILFFLAFLYCVRYGVISRLLNSFGIDVYKRQL